MSKMKVLGFSAWQLWINLVSTATFCCYSIEVIQSCQVLKLNIVSFVPFFKSTYLSNQRVFQKFKHIKFFYLLTLLFVSGVRVQFLFKNRIHSLRSKNSLCTLFSKPNRFWHHQNLTYILYYGRWNDVTLYNAK